jgi:hypothetical protein
MITNELATDLITDAKDNETEITVRLVDGTEVTGDPISVNSKGVNVKVDGKVRSISLKRIDALVTDTDEDDLEDEDDVDLAELHDGMTTAELAELLDTTPKELRVSLRALGMGVGKGNKYALSSSAYTAVKNHLANA